MKTTIINDRLRVQGPDSDGDVEIQMFDGGHQIIGTFLDKIKLAALIEALLNAEQEVLA